MEEKKKGGMCHFAWQFADIARHPKGVTELHIMPKCKWQMPMCFNIATVTGSVYFLTTRKRSITNWSWKRCLANPSVDSRLDCWPLKFEARNFAATELKWESVLRLKVFSQNWEYMTNTTHRIFYCLNPTCRPPTWRKWLGGRAHFLKVGL